MQIDLVGMMAHFAEIDDNNKVIRVLLIPDEFEKDGQKYLAKTLNMSGTWIQTSYNSRIRGKYAGIGDIYDAEKDIFYTPITEIADETLAE